MSSGRAPRENSSFSDSGQTSSSADPIIPAAIPRARPRDLTWLLCFQFFIAEQIARVHVSGPYSMALNSISDLGALHGFGTGAAVTSYSTLHGLMNASFVLQGVLIFFGAIRTRRLFPVGTLADLAAAAFALSGMGVYMVGLAPEDVGGHSHVWAAEVHFICGSLAMLLLGFALLRYARKAAIFSIAAGLIALSATLLLGFRNTSAWTRLGWHVGIVERIAAYPLPLWLTAAGLLLAQDPNRNAHWPSVRLPKSGL